MMVETNKETVEEKNKGNVRLKAVFGYLTLFAIIGMIASAALNQDEFKKIQRGYDSINQTLTKYRPRTAFDYFLIVSGIGVIGFLVTPWASKKDMVETINQLTESQNKNAEDFQRAINGQNKRIETLFTQVNPVENHTQRLKVIEQNPIVKQGEVVFAQEKAKMALLGLIQQNVKIQSDNYKLLKKGMEERLSKLESNQKDSAGD